MGRLIDLTGREFVRLTVIERAENNAHGQPTWRCRCRCGTEVVVVGMSLRKGDTRSCGCLRKEEMTKSHLKHGHGAKRHDRRASPTYNSWVAMLNRCYEPSHIGFKYYGGRGIAVCERWHHSFADFLADVGVRPSLQHSIDRINNNGNYEPGNVKWSTRQEQARNKRGLHLVTAFGEAHCTAEWAEITGLASLTIRRRLKRGLSPEEALKAVA